MLAKRAKLLFTASVLVLVAAVLLAAWGIPRILRNKIQQAVVIDNSSQMFDKWVSLPVPLSFKVYMFNVSNADEVATGAKPQLQEIGPYVYREYREKIIIGYGENDTVKYMLKKRFEFDAEQSGSLSPDDQLTLVYFPYLAALTSIEMLLPSMVGSMDGALQQLFPNVRGPFTTARVGDVLFDGIFLDCSGNHSALGLVCAQISAQKPQTMRPAEDDKNGFYFSMFGYMNLTESGPYEVYRGRNRLEDLGRIVSYKGKSHMSAWGDPYCGQLNGTDATIFPPPGHQPPARLYNFEPDICRSMYVDYVEKQTLFNLPAYYYEISSDVLASKSAQPDNKCFCKRNWSASRDGCLLMGVLSLQPCQAAPALASLPHYYLASEELLDYFAGGLAPNATAHNSYVYLDAATGVVLKGVRRLQFSVELRRLADVPHLASAAPGLLPLLWLEEGAELPAKLIEELQTSHSLIKIAEGTRWTILLIAIIFTLISAVLVIHGSSLSIWPKNSNSVSFISQQGDRKNGG